MRFKEIIAERSLADVGVRGDKFYLSARGENIDFDKFFATGKLEGVKGVSSSKTIWADFGPGMGRDVFFVMPAQDTLRANKMHRIGYDNADDLVANNSYKLGRILTIKDVSTGKGDNIINGTFPKLSDLSYRDDPVSVINHAMSIANALGKREPGGLDRFENIDKDSFGDWQKTGLRLNSIDDYANLFLQASRSAGWYGKDHAKFFAPQNRSKWYPAIRASIQKQANVYSDESEWVIDSEEFTVPKSTFVILSIPAQYMGEKPSEEDRNGHAPLWWSKFDDERYEHYQHLMAQFKNGPYKFSIVETNKASNQLIAAKTKRREAGA